MAAFAEYQSVPPPVNVVIFLSCWSKDPRLGLEPAAY